MTKRQVLCAGQPQVDGQVGGAVRKGWGPAVRGLGDRGAPTGSECPRCGDTVTESKASDQYVTFSQKVGVQVELPVCFPFKLRSEK